MMGGIQVVRHGANWAIKHRGGFLGVLRSQEEAMRLAETLAGWLTEDGRPAELVPDQPAIAPRQAA
jgi:hypothetical protein